MSELADRVSSALLHHGVNARKSWGDVHCSCGRVFRQPADRRVSPYALHREHVVALVVEGVESFCSCSCHENAHDHHVHARLPDDCMEWGES